jgi:hypothetical protein
VLSGYPRIGPVGDYYRNHEVRDAPLVLIPGQEDSLRQVVDDRARLWLLGSDLMSRDDLRRSLAAFGYRLQSVRQLDAAAPLQLVLAGPRTRSG